MRVFVAVATPIEGVPGGGPAARAPAHLSLAFLGEVGVGLLGTVETAVRVAAAGAAPFAAVVRGTGAFPDPRRPRIVFAWVTDGAEAIDRLAGSIRGALAAAGVAFDQRPFRAHLTLLRVRGPADQREARRLLDDDRDREFGRVEVRDVQVMASELTASGAEHRTLARCPLEGER